MSHSTRLVDVAPIKPRGALAVSLVLDVRHCLVVGGGESAASSVRSLLGAGAQVKLVATELVPELQHRVGWGEVAWAERPFEARDLDGMSVVVVTVDEGAGRVAELARARGLLVHVTGRPGLSDFAFSRSRSASASS